MKNFILLTAFVFSFVSLNAQVINGNFEGGSASGWEVYSKHGYAVIGTAETLAFDEADPPVYPLSGQYMARLGGFEYDEMAIAQTVTLPNTPEVYLRLYLQTRASTGSECAGLFVGARVRIIFAGQALYDTYLCNYNALNEWTYAYLNVSQYAGQTLTFGFLAEAANSVWSFIYLDNITFTTSLATSVEDEISPAEFQLEQNYPNPFNPSTKISYEVPAAGNVKITVTNLLGETVSEVLNEYQDAGNYIIDFDGTDLPSGIYIYRLESSSGIISKKMTLIK